MSKVLLINFPGEGHVNPSIGLVKELIQRGESVTYYVAEKYRKKVEKSGATFRGMDDVQQMVFHDMEDATMEVRMARFIRYMTEKTEELYPEVEKEQYDYIVFDAQMIIGKILARKLGIPSVSFHTTFADNQQAHIFDNTMIKKDSIEDISIIEDEIKRLNDTFDLGIEHMNEIFFSTGDANLVFTSRYFQPKAELFDETYKFIGPSVASRGDNTDLSLDQLEGKKVVYISMGTIFNKQPEIYECCFEAFKDMDVQVVLSIGQSLSLSDFNSIPKNFIVRHYVPQLFVLKQANAFITHCGMNSTNEALYHDVPLVMIPVDRDQPLVANRVLERNGGVKLDKDNLSPQRLKDAVSQVFTDTTIIEGSKKLGASLRDAGGFKKAVDEIFQVCKM